VITGPPLRGHAGQHRFAVPYVCRIDVADPLTAPFNATAMGGAKADREAMFPASSRQLINHA